MKLPTIDTTGVGNPPDVAAPYRSFEKLAQTAAKGLEEYSQALVKSQTQKAAVELVRGLNKLEDEIEGQKTVTTKYVREKLGPDFEALPPEVRGQLTQRGIDINTGEAIETDRDDVPTFLVADSLFDVQAQRLLGQASRHIPVDGWAASFRDQAEMTVLARKAKINERQMKAMNAYFTEEDTNDALELANGGDFAGARRVVERSKAMDLAYKAKVLDEVDKTEQVRPVYEALRNDDFAEMAGLIGKLNDPKEFTKLTQPERQSYSDRLKAEVKSFQAAVKKQEENGRKEAAAVGWRAIFDKKMSGVTPSYKDVPDPLTIDPEDQKQMLAYIDNLREGKGPKTNMATYNLLSGLGDKLADYPVMRHVNELSPTDLKHFIDKQAALAAKGPVYDDFVNTDEAINQKLTDSGIDVKDKDEGVRSGIGSVRASVQHEIAALGRRPSLAERDEIIEKVFAEKVKVEDPWWRSKRATVVNAEIPARYEVAMRQVYARLARGNSQLDQRIDADSLGKMWKDFSKYEKAIGEAWPFYARGKRLSPDEAILVYGVLKGSAGEFEAELNRAGQQVTPSHLAALAVQKFFQNRR